MSTNAKSGSQQKRTEGDPNRTTKNGQIKLQNATTELQIFTENVDAELVSICDCGVATDEPTGFALLVARVPGTREDTCTSRNPSFNITVRYLSPYTTFPSYQIAIFLLTIVHIQ